MRVVCCDLSHNMPVSLLYWFTYVCANDVMRSEVSCSFVCMYKGLIAVGQVTNQLRAVMATSCVYYLGAIIALNVCYVCVGGCVLTFECMFWLLSVCFDLWVCIVYTHYRCICTYMHTYVHKCVVQYTPCPFTFRPSPHTYINAFTCILCKVCISTSCD